MVRLIQPDSRRDVLHRGELPVGVPELLPNAEFVGDLANDHLPDVVPVVRVVRHPFVPVGVVRLERRGRVQESGRQRGPGDQRFESALQVVEFVERDVALRFGREYLLLAGPEKPLVKRVDRGVEEFTMKESEEFVCFLPYLSA